MAIKELTGFILILAALWLLWFFTNGPERSQNEQPFIAPPSENTLPN